jgi:hypothetical protein
VRDIVFFHQFLVDLRRSLRDIRDVANADPSMRWWIPPVRPYPQMCFSAGSRTASSPSL